MPLLYLVVPHHAAVAVDNNRFFSLCSNETTFIDRLTDEISAKQSHKNRTRVTRVVNGQTTIYSTCHQRARLTCEFCNEI